MYTWTHKSFYPYSSDFSTVGVKRLKSPSVLSKSRFDLESTWNSTWRQIIKYYNIFLRFRIFCYHDDLKCTSLQQEWRWKKLYKACSTCLRVTFDLSTFASKWVRKKGRSSLSLGSFFFTWRKLLPGQRHYM